MKLPFSISLFGKKETAGYYLSLLLRDEKVSAAIFEEHEGKARIIGEHETRFPTSIDAASDDELLDTVDKAISTAESPLPQNVQTEKTIFGVKSDWIEQNAIKKEYLVKLKKISEQLNLTPIGFLVISEAIAHLLDKEEGAPVSAILVEVGNKNIAVTVIRAGKVIETRKAAIEDSVPKTVDRILHHFTQHEVLPSRVILFNSSDTEKLTQEFISHAWSKSLPFLHVPKILSLAKGFDARAVLFGAATQMGFEVLSESADQSRKMVPKDFQESLLKDSLSRKSQDIDTFGFVKETDVVEKPLQTEEKEDSKQGDFAFAQSSTTSTNVAAPLIPSALFFFLLHPFVSVAKHLAHAVFSKIRPAKQTTSLVTHQQLPVPHRPINKKLLFIPPLTIGSLILVVLAYLFAIRAVVSMQVEPKVVQKAQDVVFVIGSPSDFSKNEVATQLLEVTQEGSSSISTTGAKEIGDKAKGAVTIYNSSLSEGRTFSKGTQLVASNGLVFLLDNTVNVSSASGDASSITSSTVKAQIVAKDIGKEYNLPSGTKFMISSIPSASIIAKNDSAFSGGSKKEVTVVSKEDTEKLSQQISKDLESKAREEIAKKLSDDEQVLPEFVEIKLSKKEFDKEVGQETKSVNLKATVTYKTIIVKKREMDEYAKKFLQDSFSSMRLSSKGISYDMKDVKQKKDDQIKALLLVKAHLIPVFNNTDIASQVAGKSFDEAESILMKLPQVVDVRVSLRPNIPFLPKTLPRVSKNITVVIRDE